MRVADATLLKIAGSAHSDQTTIRIVASSLALATSRPSSLSATLQIAVVWL
jgi:hypothetical protein